MALTLDVHMLRNTDKRTDKQIKDRGYSETRQEVEYYRKPTTQTTTRNQQKEKGKGTATQIHYTYCMINM